ncbi:MAG: hypothetical protein ACJATW_001309 [Glaciecola sp.]|jgi:hypothetical protein
MRGLAEFVMKGRKQAIMVVLLLGLVPMLNLLSPAIVGLVALRKGLQEAGMILVWAVLPLAGWAVAGDVIPLLMLFGITGLAWFLRETESWELTLLASILVGVCVELYMRAQPELLNVVYAQFEAYLSAQDLQMVSLEQFRATIPSFFGAVYMFLSILLLMLARWMQAALYNPGGFQTEFHGLRIKQKVAVALLAAMFIVTFVEFIPESWVFYLMMPLIFSGVALVHGLVGKRKASSMWLVAFYGLMPWMSQLIVMLALIDSWYDFRSRSPNSA